MSSKPVILMQSTAVPAAETNVFQSPAGLMTAITKLNTHNTSGSANTVVMKIVPSGGTAGPTHTQAARTLLPGESYGWPDIVGQRLAPGDFISVLPSATGMNIRGDGQQSSI